MSVALALMPFGESGGTGLAQARDHAAMILVLCPRRGAGGGGEAAQEKPAGQDHETPPSLECAEG